MRRPPAWMKACRSGSSSLRMRLNHRVQLLAGAATAMLALWAVRAGGEAAHQVGGQEGANRRAR